MKITEQKVYKIEVPNYLAKDLLHKRNIVDNTTLITILKLTFNFVQNLNIH